MKAPLQYAPIRAIRNRHRLYDRFYYLSVAVAGCCVAGAQIQKTAPGSYVLMACKSLPLSVRFPVHGVVEKAFKGEFPSHIEYGIEGSASKPKAGKVHVLGYVFLNFINPVFVEFYEAYKDWIFKKYGHQSRWPETWRFARVVRNAISHNGCIRIDSPKEAAASWQALTYSHADNGKKILGPDLMAPDLLILMVEMDAALTRDGAPITT
jgi:hypothetical protein